MKQSNWRYTDYYDFWINLDHYSLISVNGLKDDEICSVKAIDSSGCELIIFMGMHEECKTWIVKFMRSE